jgi:hypothetical protein
VLERERYWHIDRVVDREMDGELERERKFVRKGREVENRKRGCKKKK